MSLLSKFTLIILTYNRPRYALRNMRFWSDTGATVHVLDGSLDAIKQEHLSGLGGSVHYHHLPVSIWLRYAKVPSLIQTEYAAFLADDDFFIPSAVEASIVELDNNEDLVACCGIGIGKSLAPDLAVGWSMIKNAGALREQVLSGSLDQHSPVERMIRHLNPYFPSTIYSVCRSRPWIRAVELMSARQYSSGLTIELQFELSTSFRGKTRIIDNLMWLRSAENDSHVAGFELAFHTWFLDPRYVQEVKDFLGATASDLAREGGVELSAIRHGLETACIGYAASCAKFPDVRLAEPVSPRYLRFVPLGVERKLKSLVRRLAQKLPIQLLRALPERLQFRAYVDIARGLESAGVRVDWNQLNTILETVRKFHDGKPQPALH